MTNQSPESVIAEARKLLEDYPNYQQYPGGPLLKYPHQDSVERLAAALEAAEARIKELEAERDAALAAIERVRGILDRDDFGDSWEHDDWVYRDAAEKKLSEIEAALDGAPERLSNHCQECGAWGSVETHLRGCSLDGAPEPEEVEWEYAPAWDRRIPTSDRYSIDATDDSIVRRRKAGTWMPVNSGEWE